MKKIALVAVLLFALLSCEQKKNEQKLVVVFYKGKPTITLSTGEKKVAEVGMMINEGSTISTEDSVIDLQSNYGHLIRVKQFSIYRVTHIKESIRSELKFGTMYAKASKLKKEEEFVISTPTAIAGVRGTVFSVSVIGKSSEIKTYEGSVLVNSKPVNQNQMVTVDSKKKEKKSDFQPTFQEQLDFRTMVNVEKGENYEKKLQSAMESIIITPSKKSSLETLVMKNGKRIRCYVIGQHGNSVVILLTNGKKLIINKRDVYEVRYK